MPLRAILIATIVTFTLGLSQSHAAKDWIFDDGPYTVDPKSGKRVDQFQKKAQSVQIPYEKYFGPNGPGAWIPWGYYEENFPIGVGFGFGYGGGGYAGYGEAGGFGYGAYGFGSGYPAFGGYAF
ncbi:MAG TPA: hypothetical protein VMF30_14480 [Pirellulales bacterium]|nr:hypothetical protein [Pirellulales bacterium]